MPARAIKLNQKELQDNQSKERDMGIPPGEGGIASRIAEEERARHNPAFWIARTAALTPKDF
jgi:hypothetical protein